MDHHSDKSPQPADRQAQPKGFAEAGGGWPSNTSDEMRHQEQNDPVWQLLGHASKREPDAFFARNVIRQTRHLTTPATLVSIIRSQLTGKHLAAAACACACILAAFHFWPGHQTSKAVRYMAEDPLHGSSSALWELIIAESLNAAAEDPSIYTRDEIVAMIGF